MKYLQTIQTSPKESKHRNWSIETSDDKTYFITMFWGICDGSDLLISGKEFEKQSKETGIMNSMIDLTKMTSCSSATLYYFQLVNNEFIKNTDTQKWKFALLEPKNSDILSIIRFFETLCKNRGIKAEVFKYREQAVMWLNNE